MYKLTEKFLMLFPFYRERVRVMDDYAIRLSEMEADWMKCRTENADLKLRLSVLEGGSVSSPRAFPKKPAKRFKP